MSIIRKDNGTEYLVISVTFPKNDRELYDAFFAQKPKHQKNADFAREIFRKALVGETPPGRSVTPKRPRPRARS